MRIRLRKSFPKQSGFSVMEAVIAMGVLAIAVGGLSITTQVMNKQKSDFKDKRDVVDFNSAVFSRLKDPALCTDAIDKTKAFDVALAAKAGQSISFNFSDNMSLGVGTKITKKTAITNSYINNAVKATEISKNSINNHDYYLANVNFQTDAKVGVKDHTVAKILIEVDRATNQIIGCNGLLEDPNVNCSNIGQMYFGVGAVCPGGGTASIQGCCPVNGGTAPTPVPGSCESETATVTIGSVSYQIAMVTDPKSKQCDCPSALNSKVKLKEKKVFGGGTQTTCTYTCSNSGETPNIRTKLLTTSNGGVSGLDQAIECGFCKDVKGWEKYTDADNRWCYYGQVTSPSGSLVMSNLEAYRDMISDPKTGEPAQEAAATAKADADWQSFGEAKALAKLPAQPVMQYVCCDKKGKATRPMYVDFHGDVTYDKEAKKAYDSDLEKWQSLYQKQKDAFYLTYLTSILTANFGVTGLFRDVPTPQGTKNLEAPFFACKGGEFTTSNNCSTSGRKRNMNVIIGERATYYYCEEWNYGYTSCGASGPPVGGSPPAGGGGGWTQ